MNYKNKFNLIFEVLLILLIFLFFLIILTPGDFGEKISSKRGSLGLHLEYC